MVDSFYRRAGGALTLTCAGLAAAPDLDLILHTHRTGTHSITAVILVTIVAAAMTDKVNRWRIALMCGAAYATHLLLDWMAIDRYPPSGIQLLWPFSSSWFISGIDLFPQTQRQQIFTNAGIRTNLMAFAWETMLLVPMLAVLWRVREKTLTRLSAKLARGDHAA